MSFWALYNIFYMPRRTPLFHSDFRAGMRPAVAARQLRGNCQWLCPYLVQARLNSSNAVQAVQHCLATTWRSAVPSLQAVMYLCLATIHGSAVAVTPLAGGGFNGRNPLLGRSRSGQAGCTNVSLILEVNDRRMPLHIDHLQKRHKNGQFAKS